MSRTSRILVALAAATSRAFTATGVALGFLWGINHPPHVVCTTDHRASTELGQCLGHVMLTQSLHWGIALGGGMLIGACTGLLLAKLIRGTAQLAT